MPFTWGYKSTGESRLFDIEPGADMPEGWSDDVMIIDDVKKRTGEAITAAAEGSVVNPVKVVVDPEPEEPGVPRRGPGRPPKSKDEF